jgi:IS1 family transposase
MNQLPTHKRVLVLKCLVEGMSIRATVRVTGVAKATVMRLIVAAGKVCADFQDRELRDLPCRRVQADEIWSFIYAKEKNVPRAKSAPPKAGDVWTWVALCADTKLIPTWCIGDRSGMTAIDLMDDLRRRLAHRVQLTTDGHAAYFEAVEGAFGGDVDYAQLIKLYGAGGKEDERRYSPAECVGIKTKVIEGNPDRRHISTSYVERQNLTMRMSMRRFTRLTNAFSKKLENHAHAVALHIWHYNFCRLHQTIKVTPAMEAGVTDQLWEIADLVRLIDEATPPPGPRGPYRKRGNSN